MPNGVLDDFIQTVKGFSAFLYAISTILKDPEKYRKRKIYLKSFFLLHYIIIFVKISLLKKIIFIFFKKKCWSL